LALLIALAGCGSSASGTAKVTTLVHLPADQAAHASAHNEWWYLVGHLQSGNRHFGFETTVFRFHNVKLPGFASSVSLFRSDVALTDIAAETYAQHVTYYFPGSVTASTGSLDVVTPKASLQAAGGGMTLKSSVSGDRLTLHLISHRTPLLVGGRGYIPLGNGHSYYYSLTDLTASGTLRSGGKTLKVRGIAWLDHQWGNWGWGSIRGWTWMALQLKNGVQLSLSDFRGTTRQVREANVSLGNNRQATVLSLSVAHTGTWTSPHDHAVYPSGWVVRIPRYHAILHITPSVKDQEMIVPQEVVGSYWEGAGTITGSWAGKPVTGLSYTELVGYVKH